MDRKTVIEALPRLPVCSGRLLPHQSRSPRPRRDPQYKERLHPLFTSELEALEHPTLGRAADQILLLIDGVLVDAVTRPETHPAKAARELAERVLDVSQSKQRKPRRVAPAV